LLSREGQIKHAGDPAGATGMIGEIVVLPGGVAGRA
jgi:hypothetical protein